MNTTTETNDTLSSPAASTPPQPEAHSFARTGHGNPVRYSPRNTGGAGPKRPLPPDEPEDSFLQRFRIPIILGLLAAGGVGYASFSGGSEPKKEVKKSAPAPVVMIKPLPPPPPPPPPPKVQPPPPKQEEKKMEEEKPMDVPQEKPAPAKPAGEPPKTSIVGKGEGTLAYGKNGGGIIGGPGGGGGGNGGDEFKWYAGQAARPVQEALRMHPRTRTANMRVVANIWVDGSARIERARLEGSTGDPTLDAAIQNEVLPGVTLSEAPPAGMKMPIKLRLIAQRQK